VGDPFIDANKQSPKKPSPSVHISSIHSRGHSSSSSTSTVNSSNGPITPSDERPPAVYFSSLGPNEIGLSPKQKGQKNWDDSPLSVGPMLTRFPSATVVPSNIAMARATPDERSKYVAEGGRHSDPKPLRPVRHTVSIPQSAPAYQRTAAAKRDSDISPASSYSSTSHSITPTSSVALESPSTVPALRLALQAERRKYQVLSARAHEMELAKADRDRQVEELEEEASRRARELEGLKWLVMNVRQDINPKKLPVDLRDTIARASFERKIRRSPSSPLLLERPSDDETDTLDFVTDELSDRLQVLDAGKPLNLSPIKPLLLRTPKRAGLGINNMYSDVSLESPSALKRYLPSPHAPPQTSLPATPPSSERRVSVVSPVGLAYLSQSSSASPIERESEEKNHTLRNSRSVKRMNALAELLLIKDDLGQKFNDYAARHKDHP